MSAGDPEPSPQHAPSHQDVTSDPHAPLDYPTGVGLPPPIYPPSPGGYPPPPGGYPRPPGGYPGTPAFHPASDPYQPRQPFGTNGRAIASLVSSVVGLVSCCFPIWIVGLVLGVMAMAETRRTGQDGYGLALAGTIIGGLATAASLIVLLAYIALMASGWQWI